MEHIIPIINNGSLLGAPSVATTKLCWYDNIIGCNRTMATVDEVKFSPPFEYIIYLDSVKCKK